jgi:hypothetical protein
MTLGGRRAESLGRCMLALAAATRAITLLMKVLHFALEELIILVTRVVNRVEDLTLVFLLRLGGRETGIDVLRNDAKLLISSSCEAGEVSFLKRTILVQCAADKVSTVGKIRSFLGISDAL